MAAFFIPFRHWTMVNLDKIGLCSNEAISRLNSARKGAKFGADLLNKHKVFRFVGLANVVNSSGKCQGNLRIVLHQCPELFASPSRRRGGNEVTKKIEVGNSVDLSSGFFVIVSD